MQIVIVLRQLTGSLKLRMNPMNSIIINIRKINFVSQFTIYNVNQIYSETWRNFLTRFTHDHVTIKA